MTYSRIVCLTEETVETLYLLGQEDKIVGVTGYAIRPARVRREKPRVGAFTSADIPKILALNPDLVLTFSDLQAPIAADLIKAGVEVHAFNQRDVAGILRMIRTCGMLTGVPEKAEVLAAGYEARLASIAATPRNAAANCARLCLKNVCPVRSRVNLRRRLSRLVGNGADKDRSGSSGCCVNLWCVR